jgi:pre-mRNA-processing factor 19
LLGAGTADAAVRIWDVQTQTTAATLAGHHGRITSIAFSENGYHLAVTSEDASVKLWDLRKLTNFKTLALGDNETANVAAFDASASYLAVGGSNSLRSVGARAWAWACVCAVHVGLTGASVWAAGRTGCMW